jgi:hypothetical protein
VARKQPIPGDLIDGGTVVASVVLHDEPDEPTSWVLLLLRRSAPYYEVIELTENGDVTSIGEARNIVPAVQIYADNGGDY